MIVPGQKLQQPLYFKMFTFIKASVKTVKWDILFLKASMERNVLRYKSCRICGTLW